jgi:hypothetical protein
MGQALLARHAAHLLNFILVATNRPSLYIAFKYWKDGIEQLLCHMYLITIAIQQMINQVEAIRTGSRD